MKRNTIILIVVISLAVIVGGYFYYRLQHKAVVYYWRTVPVEKGDLNVMVTATGAMAADTSVDVGVQVSGIIAQIKADFNQTVKKGQVIAVLDTTLFYATKVDALANLQRADIATKQAKIEYDRSKNLFVNNVGAKADLDLAKTAYQNALGNVTSAQALLKKAAINLKYCTITAPISGIIIARNIQLGNMVIASFSSPVLFTIAYDLKKMQVQANVDEADIGLVKIDQKVKFTVDAYPNDVFVGIVTQVRHQPVTLSNVVNYVVIIEVENADLKLMPGLTANANISIEEHKNILRVATNAFTFVPPIEYIETGTLIDDTTKTLWQKKIKATAELKKQEIVNTNTSDGYLWVVRDKDLIPVLVKKLLNDGSYTEITGNIKEGDLVASGINQSAPTDDKTKKSSPFLPKFNNKKK
jgi:HlyD family secretion protein